MKNFILIIVS